MAKKTVQPATAQEEVSQIFKVRPDVYRKVRMLGLLRRRSGKPATGQDIYTKAIEEYLDRHASELEAVSA